MQEVLKFLMENPTFYLATVDGHTPKVRPFGFVMEYAGKLCFCTNNKKDVYMQLRANPEFEISVTSPAGEWLRLKGKAVFNTSRESKQAALDLAPSLKTMYSVDDSIYEIFYADEAEAKFFKLDGTSRTIRF